MLLKRFCGFVLLGALFCATAFGQDAARQNASQVEQKKFPPPLGQLELNDGDCIVFLGDSITHQRLYTQYLEDFFYTRYPHLRLKLHNAGVGGARAQDALDRFEKDVAAYKPKYVTILLGMNDGGVRSYDEQVYQTYQQNMTKLLDQIEGIGAIAIPMTPTMYDTRALRIRTDDPARIERGRLYNSVLAYFGGWLREEAYARGLGFVDMFGPLNQTTLAERKKDPNFTLIADAVHPGADGQVVMAVAVVNDLDLGKIISATQIHPATDGQWTGSAQRATLEGIQGNTERVSFTLTAESLPWVLPASAQLGVKLTHLGHRFSRESLQVAGLANGDYQLTIDGVDVGTFSNIQLAEGIELQGNEKTPQYQQALKVAELNQQRNNGPIAQLRAEWVKFQRYSHAKRGNNNAVVTMLEPEIQAIDQRVAEINAEAKAIEDQIYQVNKPQPRQYDLKLVK